jgi:hypothetical protein
MLDFLREFCRALYEVNAYSISIRFETRLRRNCSLSNGGLAHRQSFGNQAASTLKWFCQRSRQQFWAG